MWDRSTHTSPDGHNYLMIAVDSFTRKAWAVPMKSKLTDAFMNAYLAIEKQMGEGNQYHCLSTTKARRRERTPNDFEAAARHEFTSSH